MIGLLSSSFSDHGAIPRSGTSKLMHPRQMRETSKPVRPSFTYSILRHAPFFR